VDGTGLGQYDSRAPENTGAREENDVNSMDEYRRSAPYVDVVGGNDDTGETVRYRFPNTERGHGRAVEYRNAFNADLRRCMGVTDADLELERPDWGLRPGEYERAMLVESYRDHSAGLRYIHLPPIISDGDPLPTDYPHEYQITEGEDANV
jgi:hypothetical protein